MTVAAENKVLLELIILADSQIWIQSMLSSVFQMGDPPSRVHFSPYKPFGSARRVIWLGRDSQSMRKHSFLLGQTGQPFSHTNQMLPRVE